MRGVDVQRVRSALALSPGQLAEVMMVSHTTVYRWEAVGESAATIDPASCAILTVVLAELDQTPTRRLYRWAQLGRELANAVVLGGRVRALFVLLRAMFEPEYSPARRPKRRDV